jgi:hypothetical protein
MHELRVCLNVHEAKAVLADVVVSCPKKNVEVLVGVSRDDLFGSLGKPTGCRHAAGSSETWRDTRCRDEVDVLYVLSPVQGGSGNTGDTGLSSVRQAL